MINPYLMGGDGADTRSDIEFRRVVDGVAALIVSLSPSGRCEYANREFIAYSGRTLDDLKDWGNSDTIHPDDVPAVIEAAGRAIGQGVPSDLVHRLRRADGAYRWFLARMRPSLDEHGHVLRWCSVMTDVDDQKRAEAILAGEVEMLEMVALGRPLSDTLNALCRLVEQIAAGGICSILIVDSDRQRFLPGGGPNLPDGFHAALVRKTIDSHDSPCSLAVVLKAAVTTADVSTDPRWTSSEWPAMMAEHGLRACSSTPIVSGSGEVLGIFALHRRAPAPLTTADQDLTERFARIAGLAIERDRADAALRASEMRLRRAHAQLSEGQRLSKTGSFTADLQMDEHEWSDEYYRIFEIDPATRPRVQAVRDRVHPDDLERFDSEIRRGLEGGDADFTFRIVTPEAGLKHLRGVAHVIEHVAGRPIFMGTVQDITDGTLAEAALKAREADLRRAYSHLTEAQRLSKTGSFTWDVLADEHHWSEEICRFFDFPLNATVTMAMIQAAIHPGDHADVARVLGHAAEGRDFDLTFRILTRSGAVRHAHVVGHRIAATGDRPVFLGALQDVTEGKVAEAALREREADLQRANRYLTEAQRLSKTGSFSWTLATNDSRWSDEMYRIFELEPGSSVPSPLARDVIHPDDMPAIDALLPRAWEGEDFDVAFRLITPRRAVKHLHVVGHLIEGTQERPVFVGAVQDVTDRRAAEEALDRARRELSHVSRSTMLSALTASIAHEVNQPLAGILTNSNTCLRALAVVPPDLDTAHSAVARTIRDGNRASEVMKRLRALFAGKPPANEPVDLNEAAREILVLSSSALQSERVVLQTAFTLDLPAVIGDRIQLQQVILNLVVNGVQSMRGIDGRPHDLIVTTARHGDDHVMLSVRDAGVGTAAEHLEQLFHSFYTTKPDGMGVGLSISRSIVEAHDGRLWATVNDGPGLTFTLSVPAAISTLAASG